MGNTQFSFDLGANSIGWAVFGLDSQGGPDRLIESGVRIFSDGREPKSGTSLAEGRRVARGMARRRDRYKRRRKAVLRTLTEYGLMPGDAKARRDLVAETRDGKAGQAASDVYALRARALDEKVPLYHLGRALFHLNQRRGFKSNRKTDKRENDQGKINTAIADLQDRLSGRTLGQYLFEQRGDDPENRGWVRVRNVLKTEGEKLVEAYGFYPQRAMLEDEFNRIWDAQAEHYPDVLTEERRAHLFRVMFYQRPLRKLLVGKCSFNPLEERLAKAHPLFQQFRLYKEVNELKIITLDNSQGTPLTLEQRDVLLTLLRDTKERSYKSLLGKILKGQPDARFNKATDARDKMKGDEVAAVLSNKKLFGQKWFDMSEAEQWRVIKKLRETEDPLELSTWLKMEFGFDPERRDAVAAARLPEGYGRLGPTALAAMLEEFKRDVIPEAKAAKRAGYDHALAHTGEGADELPYYQEVLERRIPPGSGEPDDPYDTRMGRITNPTVHIALNQLRRVTNALISKYGKPDQIAVELARELKLSDDQKKDVNAKIAKNTKDAQRRSSEILELAEKYKHIEDNGYNRALLRFWEELDVLNRVCVYCGGGIGRSTLFSGAVDIDHILPWSKTLDNSRSNRILVHNTCNRLKRNFAPFEVPEWKANYQDILDRAAKLHPSKRWRFAPDAWERFKDEDGFLARQLTDTQYLSRMAHEYLASLYPDEEPDEWGVFHRRNHVRVVPGRLTEMLRRVWGLNSVISDHNRKNRNDHRHHAIDAIVVGVTTRGMLNRISHEAARGEELGEEDAMRKFAPPWQTFRDDVKAVVDRIVVSHKPDHGTLPTPDRPGSTAGQLHNETAYGLTGEEQKGAPVVVRRKPFLSLEPKDLPLIRDLLLRDHLETETYGCSGNDFKKVLVDIQQKDPRYKGIRRVRITEVVSVIPIRNSSGKAYKGYAAGGNHRCDIWELPDGRWDAEIVSVYDAHRLNRRSVMLEAHHNPRKIMSLQQGDMVAYERPDTGERVIARVRKFDQRNKQIYLDAHNEAGELDKRHKDVDDAFRNFSKTPNALRGVNVRQIRVDEIGQVFDPGPQDRESRQARKQAGVKVNNR